MDGYYTYNNSPIAFENKVVVEGYKPWDSQLRFADGGTSLIKISEADPLIFSCLAGAPQCVIQPAGFPQLGDTWHIDITVTTLNTGIDRVNFYHRQGAAGFVNVNWGSVYFGYQARTIKLSKNAAVERTATSNSFVGIRVLGFQVGGILRIDYSTSYKIV